MKPLAYTLVPLFAALGLGLTAWMAWNMRGTRRLPGCGGDSGCEAVTRSRWAWWGRVPISWLGMIGYAILLVAALAQHPLWTSSRFGYADSAKASWLATTAAMAVGLTAIWLVAIQVVHLRSICLYCTGVHATGLLAAIVQNGMLCERTPIAGASLLAFGLVGVFVVGQVVLSPPTYSIRPFAKDVDGMAGDTVRPTPGTESSIQQSELAVASEVQSGLATHPAAALSPAITTPVPESDHGTASDIVFGGSLIGGSLALAMPNTRMARAARSAPQATTDSGVTRPPIRQIRLAGGNLLVTPDDWPWLGATQAPQVVALFVDVTCKSCREVYHTLRQLIEASSGRLAAVIIPVPQQPDCNPNVKAVNSAANANSCGYAKLLLAVQQHDTTAAVRIMDWLMTGSVPPAMSVVADWLRQAGPATQLAWERRDDEVIRRRLRDAIQAHQAARLDTVPAIVLRDAAISGAVGKDLGQALYQAGLGRP